MRKGGGDCEESVWSEKRGELLSFPGYFHSHLSRTIIRRRQKKRGGEGESLERSQSCSTHKKYLRLLRSSRPGAIDEFSSYPPPTTTAPTSSSSCIIHNPRSEEGRIKRGPRIITKTGGHKKVEERREFSPAVFEGEKKRRSHLANPDRRRKREGR